MRTLTPEEILKAMQIYAAQFQTHPSISAEEFLKEKGYIQNHGDFIILNPICAETCINLLTEFASRQGKVVEPINDKGDKCSGCEHYFTDKHNFCPNCGAGIKWIN